MHQRTDQGRAVQSSTQTSAEQSSTQTNAESTSVQRAQQCSVVHCSAVQHTDQRREHSSTVQRRAHISAVQSRAAHRPAQRAQQCSAVQRSVEQIKCLSASTVLYCSTTPAFFIPGKRCQMPHGPYRTALCHQYASVPKCSAPNCNIIPLLDEFLCLCELVGDCIHHGGFRPDTGARADHLVS